jgi:ribosomal protein S18 acetylase RimI-like enzyme
MNMQLIAMNPLMNSSITYSIDSKKPSILSKKKTYTIKLINKQSQPQLHTSKNNEKQNIGSISFTIHNRFRAFINSIEIDKQFEGKGLGTHLMHQALAITKKHGCSEILLIPIADFDLEATSQRKKRLHRFYKKIGFKKDGMGAMILKSNL